ncbi:MAG: hypothetical protein RLZZ367_2240, partial [Bacteroidota bacterium]
TSTTNGTASVDTVTGGSGPYSYSWSKGSTAQHLTGLAPGNYLVTVTDNNGCTAASGVNVTQTGIGNIADGTMFSLWPNPATSRISISLSAITGDATVEIKNIVGQVLLSQNVNNQQTQIDISQLANGVYVAEVKMNGKRAIRQFVINR